MKKNKFTKKLIFTLAISTMVTIASCDSNLSFTSTRADNDKLPSVIANLTSGVSGSTVRISNIASLGDDIKQASSIKVAMDNGKTTYPVVRNSDGSLSFNVPANIKINSNGDFNALFILDDQKSYLATIKTGSQVKLQSPGIILSKPTGAVIKGEKLKMTANIPDEAKGKFVFNWYYSSNPSSGVYVPISGTSQTVDWTPNASGSYFIKIDMLDKLTGFVSSYTTPVSTVFVTDAKDIFSITPSSGTVLRGKQANFSVNIPNLDPTKYTFSWSVSQSAQGPFSIISGDSQSTDWNTTTSGNYFIKVDVFNKETNENSSYTSSEPILFVTESENIITTTPAQGNIVRGDVLKLSSNATTDQNSTYSWFYSSSAQGPWLSIAGAGKDVNWNPPSAGSFFIRTDVSDGTTKNVSTFISPKAVAFVTEASNVFRTNPVIANIKRGSYVSVSADIPGAAGKNYQYNWSISSSVNGSFQAIFNASGNSKSNTIKWRPANEGTYYMKVDAINIENQQIVSFTSPNPVVFVNELTPLFKTSPDIARITKDQSVDITADIENPVNTVFAWSYGVSSQGPWTSIGGTSSPKVTWDKKAKASGTYFIKLDISDPLDRSITTFVSRSPIIFVDADTTTSTSANFGGF